MRFCEVPDGRKFLVLGSEQEWAVAPVIWEKVPSVDQGASLTAKTVNIPSSSVTTFKPDILVELLRERGWAVTKSNVKIWLQRLINALRRNIPPPQIFSPRRTEKPDWRKMSVIHVTGHRKNGGSVDGPIDVVIRTFPPPDSKIRQVPATGTASLCLEDGQTVVRVWGTTLQAKQVESTEVLTQEQEPEMSPEKFRILAPST